MAFKIIRKISPSSGARARLGLSITTLALFFEQDSGNTRLGKYHMSHFYSEQGLLDLEENFDKVFFPPFLCSFNLL